MQMFQAKFDLGWFDSWTAKIYFQAELIIYQGF
jgi:hypothetical protein